jgi:hypothetical protein
MMRALAPEVLPSCPSAEFLKGTGFSPYVSGFKQVRL